MDKKTNKIGLVILVIVLVGTAIYSVFNRIQTPPVGTPQIIDHGGTTMATLGHEFTLKKSEVAKVTDADGLEIEITAFYNSPCPAFAQCIWSGVGVAFEARQNGQVQRGMDAMDGFGFNINVVKTDDETYATFLVNRLYR